MRLASVRNVFPGFGNPADAPPPADLDWEMWLGPAPARKYNPLRGLYHFRWFWDTGGGQMTNLGAHHLDIVEWVLGLDALQSVASFGGRYALTATYGGSSAFASSTSAPDWVWVGPERHRAVLTTDLNCTAKVFAGKQGTCALSVTNAGRFSAPDVTAQVNLPSQLRARYCGQFWAHQDCTISGNTASEDLGTLRPGQTRTLSVVFTAKPGFSLWGWHHKHGIKVKVIGSASAQDFEGPGAQSFSADYVTILPPGWWWAR